MSKVIAICGDSGSGKTTFSKHLKDTNKNSVILDCDRYHKWERSSHWWKSYTPLNPYSNNLEDMIEDITLLKAGHSVSRPDYNHKTGKFTELEVIEPADVIILCGLHSFYQSDYIGSFKIYLDTDEELRKEWKIARDVTERGYSEQQVLKSINSRKFDYEQYILPQRDVADLIIKQYKDDNSNIVRTI